MSHRQTEANRRNGALGGPKTYEGKEVSKLNAQRHALTSQTIVLNTEEEPLFNAMMEGYMDLLQPVGLEEIDLVREIVSGKWRQERWWGIESAILDLAEYETEPEIQQHFADLPPRGRTAYALVKRHGDLKALELVSRYEGRMRRLHERARQDLTRLQSARKAVTPAPKPEKLQPIGMREFLTDSEIAIINNRKNEPNPPKNPRRDNPAI